MKAPEKIYIQSLNVNEEDAKFERLLYFDDVWTEYPEPGIENIEYTRTDAFIEKAEEFFYSALNDGIMGTCNIEDFIQLFKNHMEGE